MADSTMSDADKIRAKRLAKLGATTAKSASSDEAGAGSSSQGPARDTSAAASSTAASAAPSSSNGTSGDPMDIDDSSPHIQSTSGTLAQPSSTRHPEQDGQVTAESVKSEGESATANPATEAPAARPVINISRAKPPSSSEGNPFAQLGLKQTADPMSASNGSAKRPRAGAGSEETFESWQDRTLASIFRLSLDPAHIRDHSGHRLHVLNGLRQELEEEKRPLKLDVLLLDQAILEAASNLGKVKPLDQLLSCWKRVSRQARLLKGSSNQAQVQCIKEARRLCMSYCIFAITMPEMFGQESSEENPLIPHLIADPEDDHGVCHDFLTEITARFAEDDSAQGAIVSAVEGLSSHMAKLTLDGDYKSATLALRNLIRYPAIVNAFTQSPRFLPSDITAPNLELDSILGPFFRISPLQGDVTTTYFSSPKTRDKAYIVSSQNALRMSSRTHQSDLLDVTNHIIKTSKESRDRMLDWFAACVNLNHKRRAMQVKHETVSSDGFMINVTNTLDQLCEPFMDATFSKIDRIDVDYLRREPRVDIKDETKLNADQNTSDAFYANKADGQSNFISEIFFLTLAAHHYGTEATNSMLSQMDRNLRHMEKNIAAMEADREKFASDPRQLQMFERALQKYKDQVDKGLCYKYAVEGVLLDDLNQTRSMQFMRYVIVWLLRLVSPHHDFPQKPFELPLSDSQMMVFGCLPEYFLDDVVSNFKFIMRNMPQIIVATQSEELIILCITFLRHSEYIKNPYLNAGLITILFHGTWPAYGRQKGVLGDLLNSMPFANKHLLHALMKFYITVETTGTHTQFYDKFNIRYEIFQIIKAIWSNVVYRDQLSKESRVNLEFFVRFVNLLLNDVTFLLDESLSSFHKIYELQEELKPTAIPLEPTVREERQELLAEAESRAKMYMQLANETVAMLKLFTEVLADSFTMPEIVQRLADMLDYNLDVMVGPKSSQLKVENPTQYGFNPRVLLSELVDVYLNLRHKENFIVAVARDGRSYKPKNLNTATGLLRKHGLKSRQEIADWTKLAEDFAKAKELDDQAEEDMGEIPDEFLDPLMFALMEDPVILPRSRIAIDRSTIRSHLLSDPHDPFNRTPLKIEDVEPATELKARIQAFKTEKTGQRRKEALNA